MSSISNPLDPSSRDLVPVRHVTHPARSWPDALIPGVLKRAFANLQTHNQVRSLLQRPPFVDTVQNNPKFAIKYLTWRYLARGLTIPTRAACFLHHYQRIQELLPDRVLRQALHWDLLLHEFHDSENCFTLTMGRSRPFYKEGEMSLNFKIDGQIFFTLSFTIVPGWVVGADVSEVLLISRLQGTPGCYPDQMKIATRAMHGVRPRTALLFALDGIAESLGIDQVAAVSAARQSCHTKDSEVVLKKAYDDCFAELGIATNAAGFYLLPVPLEEPPLDSISPRNRPRARKNRAFKQELRLTCAAFFDRLQPSA